MFLGSFSIEESTRGNKNKCSNMTKYYPNNLIYRLTQVKLAANNYTYFKNTLSMSALKLEKFFLFTRSIAYSRISSGLVGLKSYTMS